MWAQNVGQNAATPRALHPAGIPARNHWFRRSAPAVPFGSPWVRTEETDEKQDWAGIGCAPDCADLRCCRPRIGRAGATRREPSRAWRAPHEIEAERAAPRPL